VTVRGDDQRTADMFSYLSPEGRVRLDHPLRAVHSHVGFHPADSAQSPKPRAQSRRWLSRRDRSLDSIHLATALSPGSDLAGMVVYDRQLRDAARRAGLTVWSPS
jgi:hypothetical protein